MRFSEEDLEVAKKIIDEKFAGSVQIHELAFFAEELAKMSIKENGEFVSPSPFMARRVLETLGYNIR